MNDVPSRRRREMSADVAEFLRSYGRRRGQGGNDPNDRTYDREMERKLKSMPPEILDEMMRDDE